MPESLNSKKMHREVSSNKNIHESNKRSRQLKNDICQTKRANPGYEIEAATCIVNL